MNKLTLISLAVVVIAIAYLHLVDGDPASESRDNQLLARNKRLFRSRGRLSRSSSRRSSSRRGSSSSRGSSSRKKTSSRDSSRRKSSSRKQDKSDFDSDIDRPRAGSVLGSSNSGKPNFIRKLGSSLKEGLEDIPATLINGAVEAGAGFGAERVLENLFDGGDEEDDEWDEDEDAGDEEFEEGDEGEDIIID